MPCLTVVAATCPCWTEEELDTIADGNPLRNHCRYLSQTPAVTRELDITKSETAACVISIRAECVERGF